MNHLVPWIFVYLITGFEILSIGVVFSLKAHNAFMITILIFYLIFDTLVKIKYSKKFKKVENLLCIIGCCLCFIFLLKALLQVEYSLVFLKYLTYLLFLLKLRFLEKWSFISRISKHLIFITAFLGIAVILQFFVLQFYGNDLSQFEPITSLKSEFNRGDTIYLMPFWLGLIRIDDTVTFGSIKFYRAISFTTESKFFSLIVWIAFGMSIGLKWPKIPGNRLIIYSIFILALFLSHAYSSLLVLFFSVSNFILINTKLIRPSFKALLILILPVSFCLMMNGISFKLSDKYSQDRLLSFSSSFRDLSGFDFNEMSLLGWEGVKFQNVPTYIFALQSLGWIGFAFYIYILYSFAKTTIVNSCTSNASRKISVALIFGSIFGIPLLFLSQPLTLLIIFTLIYAVKLTENPN